MTQMNDNDLNKVSAGTKIPYIIQKGDTLSDIAKKFRCSIEDLCEWNHIKDPNKIMANEVIRIYF